ncbi:sugar-binding protein [Paenibacillus sp. An7]|uniref:sugar-binding protein n=1 Tax=Paenibacillus sp. An7 TaxID=2689577 RepID=UPI001EEABCE6|nr:sugar-binding protein [Paenibacillus sp. An7]
MKNGIRLLLHPIMKTLTVGSLVFMLSLGSLPDISAAAVKAEPAFTQNDVLVTKSVNKEAPVKTDPGKISVGTNGLDSKGRMVAQFGSPVIDGKIDPIWNKAHSVSPKHVSANIDTSATFKALWDDRALYILAEVKDKNLSVQSGTPHMQDSVEVFLDENNDKTTDYGAEDLHIRVNYENALSVDNGDPNLYYTAAKKVKDGYVIETRIALKTKPENGKVLGIELQINDAVGTERIGSLNLFDATGTAWNDPSKFGEILLTGKAKKDVSGLNPYDLFSLVKNALQLDFKLYKNANLVTDALTNVVTESVLNGQKITQEQIDSQYAAITSAISKLEMTEEAANEKYFKPLPNAYRAENTKSGKIESIHYKTPNVKDGMDDKKLNVYLPYGYDASAADKKYNVLYLMHGGGENEDLLFGGPGQSKELKKILDNMIALGDIEPLIVVTPTFNDGKNDVALFNEELIDTIVPLVEKKYNTYAKSGSLEDLKNSREHRAFGGFSMGSVTTWYTFIHALDYFKYYIPLSGDSWVIEQRGGGLQPEKTAEYLANVAKKSGYKPQDYYIFSATGKLDIAYPNLKPQIDAMKKLTDVFVYSSDTKKGNFYFMAADSGTHAWNWQNQYIYNILPDLFSN